MQVQRLDPARSPSPRSTPSLPPPAALVAATSTATTRRRHLRPLRAATAVAAGLERAGCLLVMCAVAGTAMSPDYPAVVNTGKDGAFRSSCRVSLRESVVSLLAA
jgi:hypothetical protein